MNCLGRVLFLFFLMLSLLLSQEGFCLVQDDLTKEIDIVPGGEYPLKIMLVNSEDRPVTVTLSQSDYKYEASGENHYLPPGTLDHSNAAWIELQTNRVEIPPKTTTEVYYVVRVPKKLEHRGAYWSLIFIEPDSTQTLQDENALIQVKIRYAYQVITNHGKGVAKLKLLKTSVGDLEGVPYLFVDVENNGELFLRPKLTVKLFDHQGKIAANLDSMEQSILPGMSIRFPIPLTDLAPQTYTGLILLRQRELYFGDKFTFTIPAK